MSVRKIYSLLILLIPFLFVSCDKDPDKLDDNEKFTGLDKSTHAMVKLVHAYTATPLNGLSTTTTGFRIFMNGNKINGATNTSSSLNTLRYGDVFPGTTSYAYLPAGSQNFTFVLNRIVSGNFSPTAGDEIFNTSKTLDAGKNYSIFLADPYPSPDAFMIEDNYMKPALDHYGFRFINLCGDTAKRFDVISLRHGVLFTDVGNMEVKDYIYPSLTTTADTIFLRLAGTNTTVSQVNTFIPALHRVYTFYARGKTGVTGRTPSLTFYTNR